jgi:cytidylate kinase
LIANLEDRAKRRMLDLNSDGEVNSIEEVIEQIKKRDDLDSSRKNSPLRMSKDAVLIDTSYLSINAQINKIVDIIIN